MNNQVEKHYISTKKLLLLKKWSILFSWLLLNMLAFYIQLYHFSYLYLFIVPIEPITKFLHLLNIYRYYLIKLFKKLFKIKEEQEFDDYINDKIAFTITCYTESFDEIQGTIDSLCDSIIESKKQSIIFVIYDGLSKEKGTGKYTWELIMEKMEITKYIEDIDYNENWKKIPNKINIGFCKYRDLIIVNIIKQVNLGKTDSLTFTRDLLTGHLNDNITEILTTEINENNFDISDIYYCGSMDADCYIDKDAVEKLHHDISLKDIVGVSGIVYPRQEQVGFWSIYQFAEYYSSQLLTRLSMSIMGNVTCLPGALNIFDLHGYTDKVRNEFLLYPNKRNMCRTLSVVVGEDRRFTGLSLYHNPTMKTMINTDVKIYTTVPDSLIQMISQRRRWLTASCINDYYDVIGTNIRLIVRIEALGNLISLSLYLFVYVMLLSFFMGYIVPFYNKQPFVYFLTIMLIIALFVLYKIILVTIRIKKIRNKCVYIVGEILFIFFAHLFVILMLFKCILSLDNFGWGNVHQNVIETVEKVEEKVEETLEVIIS